MPGAWHSPAHFSGLIKILKDHEYQCETVTLGTVDPIDPPNTDCDTDVTIIEAAIRKILSTGTNITIVAHSSGGIPAQSAAYTFSEGLFRVVSIAMICSFLYPPNTALIRPFGGRPAPFHHIHKLGHLVDVGEPGPEVLFYGDVTTDEAARSKAMLKPHSWHSKAKAPSSADVGWWSIPTSYLICKNDNAIPADFQQKMVVDADETMVAKGSAMRIRVEAIDSSHSPFLSMPERTVDFIRRAQGEDIPIGETLFTLYLPLLI